MLNWRELLLSAWRLYRLSCRLVFHRKLVFMVAGILVYYGALYAFAIWRPGEGFGTAQALFVLVEVPGTVLAIYLTMDLVAGERDRRTLEVLFSTSSSHYTIWTVRMMAIYMALMVALLGMSMLAYFTFAELPAFWGGLNACLPAFLMASLTFFFSVFCRSGNAAGMLSLGLLILFLLIHGALGNSTYNLFLSPFDSPIGLDLTLWDDQVVFNRLGVAGLSALFLFLGLRRMESRERLLS